MRFSLREFIGLTAVASFVIVAVYFANGPISDGLHFFVGVAVAVAIVTAAAGSNQTRIVAIGFLGPQIVFFTDWFSSGPHHFWNLLTPAIEYLQAQRGEMGDDNGDPAWLPLTRHAGSVAYNAMVLFLGYLGSKYASHIYTRRVEREQSAR